MYQCRAWAALFLIATCVGCGREEVQDGGPIARGRRLYLDNGCNVCHGNEGHGDGPVARNLNPKPRDFSDVEAYKRGPELAQIERTIHEGLSIGQGAMPAFPNIDDAERRDLALYIQSLQTP